VEKPFALSLAEGRRIVQLAGRKRVQIVAGQNYRYHGDLAAMAQLVRAGAVGQLGAADSAKALTSKTCGTIISGKWRCTISI
jgi:predicted dehydrogenase